jgi:hypothetical protein
MRYSIIIPHCHGARESALQREELQSALRRLDRHEILTKFAGCPTVEHAIVAGLRTARGEAVVVVEPGDRYPLSQLPLLLRALARADFVCGRRRRRGLSKLMERLVRLPRWLLLGQDIRDPECLFWAARREVFNGLQLLPRFVRHLPSLVARQGFRVDNVYVEERPAVRSANSVGAEVLQTDPPHVAPAGVFAVWRALRMLRSAKAPAPSMRANAARGRSADVPTAAIADSTHSTYQAKSA